MCGLFLNMYENNKVENLKCMCVYLCIEEHFLHFTLMIRNVFNIYKIISTPLTSEECISFAYSPWRYSVITYYFIDIHRNSLVDYLLDGSAIKEALEHGKEIDNKPCEELYVSCPLDSASATNILMKLLPKKSKIGKSKASNANANA